MEQQLLEIRDQQKASWNKFSTGWRKWDGLVNDFLQPMGDEIISLIKPAGTDLVLDIAAGTGEPGLTIATMLNGGKVVITDIAEDMLAVARDYATERDIYNIETVVADACELPFADNTFDAISCRMGFMFFPDMLMAAKEMVRVLKPGGRIATSVWDGPEKNFWVTAMTASINKHVEMVPPPPGAPGLFRCAKDGFIAELFAQAGLKNISQRQVAAQMNCQTADVYWDFTTEVVAPVVAVLSKTDEATRDKIKTDLYKAVHEKYPEGKVLIDAGARVIYGEK
jgi:ubiquinone/menaquinone biosynthesis C-methylase UbiE